jgi:hypothetical protein
MDGLVGKQKEAMMRGDWAEGSRLATSHTTVRLSLSTPFALRREFVERSKGKRRPFMVRQAHHKRTQDERPGHAFSVSGHAPLRGAET